MQGGVPADERKDEDIIGQTPIGSGDEAVNILCTYAASHAKYIREQHSRQEVYNGCGDGNMNTVNQNLPVRGQMPVIG